MPGGRVLAARHLDRHAPEPLRLGTEARQVEPGRQAQRRPEALPLHVRQVERAAPPRLGPALGAGARDMADGIGPGIAEVRRIRRATDPGGIHDEKDRAAHQATRSSTSGPGSGAGPIR